MDEISLARMSVWMWVYVGVWSVLQETIAFSSVDIIEKMFIHSGYGNINNIKRRIWLE